MMPVNYLEFWFSAKSEEVGVIIMTNDRNRLSQKLYAVRREYHETNPGELEGLSICMSPTSDQELWIVHKVVKTMRADDENN